MHREFHASCKRFFSAQAAISIVLSPGLLSPPCEAMATSSAAASKDASAAQPAASAAQPATTEADYQSLQMLLSKQSVKIGQFKVIVFRPWVDTYTYQWEGKPRETTSWRCTLVNAADPTLYCVGEFKHTAKNKAAFDKNKIAHEHGTVLILSNVSFVEGAKSQYMSCSVRVNINMASTKVTGVFTPPSAVQPVPKTSVAQTKEIQQNQNFDMTAFILSSGLPRHGGEGRKAFDLELADGSKDEASGKMQTVEVTVFASESEADALLDFAGESIAQRHPVSFFNLTGAKNKENTAYTFASARKGFSMIVAESPRASEMRAKAPELYNLEEKAPVPKTQWTPIESFFSQSATGTTIKFLKSMGTSAATGIEAIDAQSTLWQLNWVQILEPVLGTSLRAKDESRLWFQVLLRDFHGSMAIYMTEAAALKCAGQANASSFEEAHRAGRLCFPIVASVKILRKKGDDSNFDYYVVDCGEQDYASAPTTKTLELLNLLPRQAQSSSVEQPADTFLAAPLADIHASAFYPLTVRYTYQTLPETLSLLAAASADGVTKGTTIYNCTSVLALVGSSNMSQKESINKTGTTVTTHGVKDLLADDGREYTLTAHCATDTHMDFMLTPPKRAADQKALVVICGMLDNDKDANSAEQPARNFLVESVQPLHDDDAKVAKALLLKLISLIALAGQSAAMKRERSDWSPTSNPASQAKCRSIARYPTGDEIPSYQRSA